MTVSDLRCDWCASVLTGLEGSEAPAGRTGVRFTYHPGSPALKDDSNLLCKTCWETASAWLGAPAATPAACSICNDALGEGRLVVTRTGELTCWLLCRVHAVEFLNRLRTVEPKLDPGGFSFPPLP